MMSIQSVLRRSAPVERREARSPSVRIPVLGTHEGIKGESV